MRVLVATLLLSLSTIPVWGQTLWSRPYEPNQIAVEAIVPDAAREAGPLTGATFVTGTASLSDNVEFLAELPVARYAFSSGGSTTALGNPFIGLGLSSTTVPFLFQLGARVPVASGNRATAIGDGADVGRTPAFRPDQFALSGLLNSRLELGRYSTLRVRSGILFGSRPVTTVTGPTREQEWWLPYEAQIWREGDRFLTGITFAGQALLTSPGTTQHHAALSLMGNWNLVQPGLLVGTSLNDLFQNGEFTPFAGLTLSVSYGRL